MHLGVPLTKNKLYYSLIELAAASFLTVRMETGRVVPSPQSF